MAGAPRSGYRSAGWIRDGNRRSLVPDLDLQITPVVLVDALESALTGVVEELQDGNPARQITRALAKSSTSSMSGDMRRAFILTRARMAATAASARLALDEFRGGKDRLRGAAQVVSEDGDELLA